MISVITPTGDRSEAFCLCKKWMSLQTVKPDQWLVVDDGKEPLLVKGSNLIYIRREPQLGDKIPTLLDNLKAALPYIDVSVDKILICEDDEYYSPQYIEKMSLWLDRHEIVGIGRSRYYHLPSSRYHRDSNMDHASLAQTGFRRSFLSRFEELLNGDVWLDIRIWKEDRNKHVFDDGDGAGLYVGMKGLPGRPGIGIGHREYMTYNLDVNHEILKRWTSDASEIYLDLLRGKLTKDNICERLGLKR